MALGDLRINGSEFVNPKIWKFSKNCQRCEKPLIKQQRKWCAGCAYILSRQSIRAWELRQGEHARWESMQKHQKRKEYSQLLANADSLNMCGFIKLLALAEFYGRDIDEWINESENLSMLNSILHAERELHDMGTAQKTSPDYLAAKAKHEAAIQKQKDYHAEYYRRKKKGL